MYALGNHIHMCSSIVYNATTTATYMAKQKIQPTLEILIYLQLHERTKILLSELFFQSKVRF